MSSPVLTNIKNGRECGRGTFVNVREVYPAYCCIPWRWLSKLDGSGILCCLLPPSSFLYPPSFINIKVYKTPRDRHAKSPRRLRVRSDDADDADDQTTSTIKWSARRVNVTTEGYSRSRTRITFDTKGHAYLAPPRVLSSAEVHSIAIVAGRLQSDITNSISKLGSMEVLTWGLLESMLC